MDVLRTRNLLDAGRTAQQLNTDVRTGTLTRLRRGAFTVPGTRDAVAQHRLLIEAAAGLLGGGTYFALESAAVLHGLPLLSERVGLPAVYRTNGGHGNISATLRARRASLERADCVVVDGFPVTSLQRTVADLLRVLPFSEGVILADAALRNGVDTGSVLDQASSGPGCRRVARALAFADSRSESPGESLSRVRIAEAGLPAPELQHEVRDGFGRLIGRGDFWWEEFGVVGEFDGKVKYGEFLRPGQRVEDVVLAQGRREQDLLTRVRRVVRWNWDDLSNGVMVARLRSAFTMGSR